MGTNLKVFLSYCSKHSALRDAFKQLIPTMWPCEVISDQNHGQSYSTASDLMEDMVKRCDVAIFLLTDENAEDFFLNCDLGFDFTRERSTCSPYHQVEEICL